MLIEKVQSGVQQYEQGSTDMKASLKAIPILFIVNMEVGGFDLYGGMGASYVWSDLEAFDDHITSEQWNYSLMFSAGYTYMFTDYFGLGAEAKSYIFTNLNKVVGSLELKMSLSLFEW